MSRENPLWGAPRIHGELLKLGFEVSEATVSKYLTRQPKPPSQTWRTFLRNHVECLAAYFDYYHRSRTHLSLGKDAPNERPVPPADTGKIVSFPQVGGLHHRYERIAA